MSIYLDAGDMLAQDALGIGDVSAEVPNDHFDGDGCFRFVPAVVIGGAGDGGVA